jgi:pimeloyl-CoA synthetase
MSYREKRINEALRYYGLSVIIRTEDEFNHIKKFLSHDVLWVNFVPQMATKLTAIVIWSDDKDYSTGSVGCAESQKEEFIRVVEFNDFFKI